MLYHNGFDNYEEDVIFLCYAQEMIQSENLGFIHSELACD